MKNKQKNIGAEKKNLFIGVALAPYRVDLLNYLHDKVNCDIYQLHENVQDQAFNQQALIEKSTYIPKYLCTSTIFNRIVVDSMNMLIKKSHPEVIFVPEFSLVTIQVVLLRLLHGYKYKIVSVCDDSIDLIENGGFSRWHGVARRLLLPFIDNLIIPSDLTRYWYQRHYGKGVWFPIIADEKRMRRDYSRVLPLANKLREDYGLQGKKVVLFVGRLTEVKNIPTLINAFAHVANDEACLVIVGGGELDRQLKQQAQQHDADIIFIGRKEGDELLAWYDIADIFVLPSMKEPFGAVTNEALIAGCYALVSNRAGSACLIEKGVNGNTFSPDDTASLTSLISNAMLKVELRDEITLRENRMKYSFENMLKTVISELKINV